ncbi:MAG: hypothetical protein IJA34_11415 [Lachnospiraceae bacterium]|nr:hypothetical protein [Lachnospiraceae bacterium]
MYDPRLLQEKYHEVEHGKARISAIKAAIQEADENNDVLYSVMFRLELCNESEFYYDSMDLIVTFPQILKIIDVYPEIQNTFRENAGGLDIVLWTYKWVVALCSEYYQISMDDCLNFLEDFKKRSISAGYNLKPYYKYLYLLYEKIDTEYADKCFFEFMKLTGDENGDCAACDRNIEINYYLNRNNIEKANELAKDIEEYKLICNDSDDEAWLRMKSKYMKYYLKNKDFDNAITYINQIKRKISSTKKSEYNYDDSFFYCYTHTDIGKALNLYKENWKAWIKEKCPAKKFDMDVYVAIFFKKLGKECEGETIKLELDKSFPLYNYEGIYKIKELEKFYYNSAKDIALKFDKRNGTDYFMNELCIYYGE